MGVVRWQLRFLGVGALLATSLLVVGSPGMTHAQSEARYECRRVADPWKGGFFAYFEPETWESEEQFLSVSVTHRDREHVSIDVSLRAEFRLLIGGNEWPAGEYLINTWHWSGTGASELDSDGWFAGTLPAVQRVTQVDPDPHNEHIPEFNGAFGSRYVGVFGEDRTQMDLCWCGGNPGGGVPVRTASSTEPPATPDLGTLKTAGRGGFEDACWGACVHPGALDCSVVGDPLPLAESESTGTAVTGDHPSTSAGSEVPTGQGSEDDVIAGAEGVDDIPGDADGGDGLLRGFLIALLVSVACVAGAAGAVALFRGLMRGREPRSTIPPPPPPPPPGPQPRTSLASLESPYGHPGGPRHPWISTVQPEVAMEGLDQHNTVVRIEPGATYPWRPLDGDTAAVWVPEGSGGRWVAVPQAHVRPGHHAHLRSFTPDGSLPPPPPPGVDISGSFGTRILGADSSSQLLLEAWDPQRPDDAVRLIGNLEPGTYLTGEPVGNRIPVYDHTRRLWGWVIRGGA